VCEVETVARDPPAEKENALSGPRRSPADLAPGAGRLRTGTGKPPGAAGVARNYKFIGDGVLAIFPVTGTTAEACEAALCAGKSPVFRRERAKSRETRTLHWRKTDSNSRSLREGKGCGQPLQASIAVSDLNL
jgi:hypothetical protein